MLVPSIPKNERERIKALNRFKILDTLPEKEYDDITFIASQICNTPISLISLVDPDRQWFKSHHGLDVTETPREMAFCAHAIHSPDKLFEVKDSRKDDRFFDNPLVKNPEVIFYAGAPLNTSDGYSLGTLCVIDHKPNELTEDQRKALKALADQVMAQFELRLKNDELKKINKEITDLNKDLDSFAHTLSHDLKTPIRGIASLTSWIVEEYESILDDTAKDWLGKISERTEYMDSLVKGMLEYAQISKIKPDYQKFNLADLLEEITDNFDPKENLTYSLVGELSEVTHYRFGWKVILQNLISNTVKYSNRPDPHFEVSAKVVKTKVVLEYFDNGPGIPEDKIDKAFQLFGTLVPKTHTSTGIGLATIKSVVKKMKGKLYLTNHKPSGVHFTIELPIKN